MKIFGLRAEEVEALRSNNQYNVWAEFSRNDRITGLLNRLRDGTFSSSPSEFCEIYDSIVHSNDYFFVLKDLDAYIAAWQELNDLYKVSEKWNRISLLNIASAGYFSSDRTISEYADDIWKVRKFSK